MLTPTVLRAAPTRSLRGRLLLVVTALAATVVLASQFIGYQVLGSWLTGRVDQQLRAFQPPPPGSSGRSVFGPAVHRPPTVGPVGPLPSDFRIYFYDVDGELTGQWIGDPAPAGPRLPAQLSVGGPAADRPATVPAESGQGRWRVLLLRDSSEGSGTLVALPLDTVDGTMSKLLWLDVAVLGGSILVLVAAGAWLVRLGLLPLIRMERTARAITGGELDLRLTDTDPRTEIGRFGQVLNTMLDRLQQALRAHEASEARLRRFVADAGHELRTPLTTIKGFTELALRHPQSAEERREANRLVAQNAERMSLIVDDLQLLTSLDREPLYRREPVDLLSVGADAVGTAALHHPGHPVDLGPLRTAADPTGARELELVETVGDGHRLRQLVAALISNAHTHTPPGTPVHVRVGSTTAGPTTGGTDRPGRTSAAPPLAPGTPIDVIEVADDGPGLAPADAAQAFDRFYRADPARSRARARGGSGSGLGLAIASTIAQGHGGRLELDTAPAPGCTFRLVLPRSG
ncbi:sensor histidine kinase [Kitasatospora viridis]|uniref:histidine kinase n=1 Tax=Kitasatospora viridis TaxID=281105 RepID=A0A561UFZ6_9ACTN|nr:ATP-binding protein [Kitasatospora viridis]TWF98284.1 two-component system OmpR family sensor kinase [Kitasatospora viridis]